MLSIIHAKALRAKVRLGPIVGPVKKFEKKSRSEVTITGPEPAPSAPGWKVATVVPLMLLLIVSLPSPGQPRYAAAVGAATTLISGADGVTVMVPPPTRLATADNVCAPTARLD